MTTFLARREFLGKLPCAFGGALLPLAILGRDGHNQENARKDVCWLDVCAPFVVESDDLGLHTEIILTSDTFSGSDGHEDGADATEYEIFLYDPAGRAIGSDGVAKRLVAPAMHTTVLRVSDLIGDRKDFIGGLKVRLRPRARTPMHASDLFSSAFIRLTTPHSFDNVHANPDPLQWQRTDSFFYSMPFPPLDDYECFYSLFNPYSHRSSGDITLTGPLGQVLKKVPYDVSAGASIFLDLRKGELVSDMRAIFSPSEKQRAGSDKKEKSLISDEGGTVSVVNRQGSVKNFGYLLIRRRGEMRFSIDHPIHQTPYEPDVSPAPFDTAGRFKPKNILYTPLLFNSKRIGGITLNTRYHLSSGLPVEKLLWLSALITDKDGGVAWQLANDKKLRAMLPGKQQEAGALKLGARESCILDCSRLDFPGNFSGGLLLPISPTSNHTLMKVEVRVSEWGAHAFTHFRPGLGAARAYQKPRERGRLATDYITSGARLERKGSKILRDEIVSVLNIDDLYGQPTLEIFGSKGLIKRVSLGDVPGMASRHYLLSELTELSEPGDLSLRLVDTEATLLMSVVHIDYVRRDIALDHGSDRFSTFNDFNCDAAKPR